MKMIWIFLLMGLILFTGCTNNSENNNDVCTESTGILFSNVKVIDNEKLLDVVELNSTHKTLLLDTAMQDIQEDDVLVFDTSPEHPAGMIKKVSIVSKNNNVVELAATTAGLGDVFQELSLCHRGKLKENSINKVNLKSEIPDNYDGALGKETELYDFTYTIDKAFAKDVVHLIGKIHFNIDYNLVIKTKSTMKCSVPNGCKLSVKLLNGTKFTISSQVSTDLTLNVEREYEKKENKLLYSVNFEPITILVAGVPVVIVPELYIFAGIDIDVDGSMESGIWAKSDATLGIKYYGIGRGWHSVAATNHSFGENPLSINASAKAKAYVGPSVQLKLYDITGPYANIFTYAELDADIDKNPWWKLHAGIESHGGFKVKVLHHSLGNVEEKLYSKDFIIVTADGKFP